MRPLLTNLRRGDGTFSVGLSILNNNLGLSPRGFHRFNRHNLLGLVEVGVASGLVISVLLRFCKTSRLIWPKWCPCLNTAVYLLFHGVGWRQVSRVRMVCTAGPSQAMEDPRRSLNAP